MVETSGWLISNLPPPRKTHAGDKLSVSPLYRSFEGIMKTAGRVEYQCSKIDLGIKADNLPRKLDATATSTGQRYDDACRARKFVSVPLLLHLPVEKYVLAGIFLFHRGKEESQFLSWAHSIYLSIKIYESTLRPCAACSTRERSQNWRGYSRLSKESRFPAMVR